MSYPVVAPFPQFRDLAGNPLNGGYIYIGTANANPQTNPISVYWDIGLTISATQPLRTSGGYIFRNGSPANVFVDRTFSITVRDQNGALVYSNPDFGISFNEIFISPESYGAVGDGVTNDSVAMTAAAAAAVGKTLKLTPGKNYLIANVNVPASPRTTVVDMTSSAVKSLVLPSGNGSPIFNVTGTGKANFVNGYMDGQKGLQPADGFSDSFNSGVGGTGRAYRSAIKADATAQPGISQVTVEGVFFIDTYGSPVATLDVPQAIVHDCHSETCNFEIAFLYWSASSSLLDGQVYDNIIDTPASGDATVNANGIVITNYRRVKVHGNVCYAAERNLCKIEGGRNISIIGNIMDTNTVNDFSGIQIAVTSSLPTSRVVISGNDLYSVSRGITVTVSSGQPDTVSITDNNIYTTKGAVVGDAIAVDTATNLTISGNQCVDVLRNGILVTGTSNRVKIEGNTLYGQGAGNSHAILLTATTGSWGSASISDNHCEHFSETTNDGVLTITRSASNTFANLAITDNTVLAGASGNFGIHIPADCVLNGVVRDNIVDGQINLISTGIDTRDNKVSGLVNIPLLTFTPVLQFGGASTGITYAANGQIGRYRRDGNRVFYQITLILTSKGSASGAAAIIGMPVAALAVSNDFATASVYPTKVTATQVGILMTQNTSTLDIGNIVSGAAFAALTDAAFANDSALVISGAYEVVNNG